MDILVISKYIKTEMNSDLVMALYNGANHGGTYNDLVYAKQKGVPAVNIYNNVMKLLGKK